jgi:hypothetical protein
LKSRIGRPIRCRRRPTTQISPRTTQGLEIASTVLPFIKARNGGAKSVPADGSPALASGGPGRRPIVQLAADCLLYRQMSMLRGESSSQQRGIARRRFRAHGAAANDSATPLTHADQSQVGEPGLRGDESLHVLAHRPWIEIVDNEQPRRIVDQALVRGSHGSIDRRRVRGLRQLG